MMDEVAYRAYWDMHEWLEEAGVVVTDEVAVILRTVATEVSDLRSALDFFG